MIKKKLKAVGWAITNGKNPVIEHCECHSSEKPLYFIFVDKSDAEFSKSKWSTIRKVRIEEA